LVFHSFVLDTHSHFWGGLHGGLLASPLSDAVLFFLQAVRFVGSCQFFSQLFAVFDVSASAFSGASRRVLSEVAWSFH